MSDVYTGPQTLISVGTPDPNPEHFWIQNQWIRVRWKEIAMKIQ